MRYFPLFYDLENARIAVIGGGEEALRKIRLLLKTPAQIEVIADDLHPELNANPRVMWKAKTYQAKHLDGVKLVFSSVPEWNAQVSADAMARGIPVNAVDDAALSSFLVPSIVDRDPVVIAIGTEGAAPVLAQALRSKIDAFVPSQLGAVARRASALRTLVAEKIEAGKRRRSFWADFFFGSVADALKDKDEVAYELAVGDALFHHAHSSKGRLTIISAPADIDELTLKAQRRLMEADVIGRVGDVAPALIEMARRDAVRIDGTENLLDEVKRGQLVVVLGNATALKAKAEAEGVVVETVAPAHAADHIYPEFEKAAS
ncbi:NAD(P)-dependent oxidoreductase [Aestuariivirga litoralis]|uniref:NAD(P)-dependent oxidoreductase n=1 Tax=Aestuariivirga litoralis TaxID=2650924 RepID=UPI0018C7D9B4|nr:NAD(P)-dependent oxidoreductase [Aestuariivirga litoralis]MBG1231587.1 siroheme synthase [Aestuariivirga litoralis]